MQAHNQALMAAFETRHAKWRLAPLLLCLAVNTQPSEGQQRQEVRTHSRLAAWLWALSSVAASPSSEKSTYGSSAPGRAAAVCGAGSALGLKGSPWNSVSRMSASRTLRMLHTRQTCACQRTSAHMHLCGTPVAPAQSRPCLPKPGTTSASSRCSSAAAQLLSHAQLANSVKPLFDEQLECIKPAGTIECSCADTSGLCTPARWQAVYDLLVRPELLQRNWVVAQRLQQVEFNVVLHAICAEGVVRGQPLQSTPSSDLVLLCSQNTVLLTADSLV